MTVYTESVWTVGPTGEKYLRFQTKSDTCRRGLKNTLCARTVSSCSLFSFFSLRKFFSRALLSERREQASLNIGLTPVRKNNVFVVSLFARIFIRSDSPIPSPQ